MREVRQGIKRMEKLMNSVSGFQAAIKLLISETPNIQEVLLILGATPLRPQYVYELCFLNKKVVVRGADDFDKHKAAEVLSRKVFVNCLTFLKILHYLIQISLLITGYSNINLEGCWLCLVSRYTAMRVKA